MWKLWRTSGLALALGLGAFGCQGEAEDQFGGGAAGEGGFGGSQIEAVNGQRTTWAGTTAGDGLGECRPVDVERTGRGAEVTFEASEAELREICAGVQGADYRPMQPVQYEPWRPPEPIRAAPAPASAPARQATRAPQRSAPATAPRVTTPTPDVRVVDTGEEDGARARGTLVINGEPLQVGDRVVLVLPEGEALVRDTEQGIVVTIRPDRAEDAAAMRARLERWVERNRVTVPARDGDVLDEVADDLRVIEAWEELADEPVQVRPEPTREPLPAQRVPTVGGELREIQWPDTRDAEPVNLWESAVLPAPTAEPRAAPTTDPRPTTRPRYETIEWRDLGVVPPDPDGDGDPVPLYPQRERLMVPPRLPGDLR